jgi:hypothetical protein
VEYWRPARLIIRAVGRAVCIRQFKKDPTAAQFNEGTRQLDSMSEAVVEMIECGKRT